MTQEHVDQFFKRGTLMEDKVITLTLNVNEINVMLGALGKGPYEVVEPLIAKIRAQAVPQVEQPAAETNVEE